MLIILNIFISIFVLRVWFKWIIIFNFKKKVNGNVVKDSEKNDLLLRFSRVYDFLVVSWGK